MVEEAERQTTSSSHSTSSNLHSNAKVVTKATNPRKKKEDTPSIVHASPQFQKNLYDAVQTKLKLEKQLAAATSEVDAKQKEINSLKQAAKDSKSEIHTLRTGMNTQSKHLQNVKDEIAKNTQNAKAELAAQQAISKKEIVQLSNRAIELENQMNALAQEKSALETEIIRLNSTALKMVAKPPKDTQADEVNALKRERAESVVLIDSLNKQVTIPFYLIK